MKEWTREGKPIVKSLPYTVARNELFWATLKISTFNAVQSALGPATNVMRLCPREPLDVCYMAPVLYLRLGQEQECHNFISIFLSARSTHEKCVDFLFVEDHEVNLLDDITTTYSPTKRMLLLFLTVSAVLLKVRLLMRLKRHSAGLLTLRISDRLLGAFQSHRILPFKRNSWWRSVCQEHGESEQVVGKPSRQAMPSGY